MELRAKDTRPVLLGDDGTGPVEVDPDTLPLGRDLATALREWARVAGALSPVDEAVRLVAVRGTQLATRVAAATGVPVTYVDPVTGSVFEAQPPREPTRPAPPPEPTPWSTGGAVAGFVLVVSAVGVIGLASTLNDTNAFLAVISTVVLTAGLAPSIWLARKVRTWRWVAGGVAGGLAIGWLALPFIVFS